MQRHGMWLLFGVFALLNATTLVRGQRAEYAASPVAVANLLDQFVQPRFLQNAGMFGADRLEIDGHDDTLYMLKPKSKVEERLIRSVSARHRDYALGFVHCVHKPGKFLSTAHPERPSPSASDVPESRFEILAVHEGKKNSYPKSYEESWADQNGGPLNDIIKRDLPRLRRGQNVDVNTGNWFLALRPLKASREASLGCHRGAKRGDTLGIMAYAVSTRQH